MSYSPAVQQTQSERRNVVRRMTLDGASAHETATFLGCTARTVHRDRHVLGLSKSQPGPLSEDEIGWAREMVKDGCPLHEIAETLDRHPRTIQKHCRGLSKLKYDSLRKYRQLMKQLDLL